MKYLSKIINACMAILILSLVAGYFIPQVDCWNKAGTQLTYKSDTIIQINRHTNCTCDTAIYIRRNHN